LEARILELQGLGLEERYGIRSDDNDNNDENEANKSPVDDPRPVDESAEEVIEDAVSVMVENAAARVESERSAKESALKEVES